MTLKDFYIGNDMISDFFEITVHTDPKTYKEKTVAPLESVAFNYYLGWTIEYFCMDANGHWHLLVNK